jgi:hypothetical protein
MEVRKKFDVAVVIIVLIERKETEGSTNGCNTMYTGI